jgi:hypothetical protein
VNQAGWCPDLFSLPSAYAALRGRGVPAVPLYIQPSPMRQLIGATSAVTNKVSCFSLFFVYFRFSIFLNGQARCAPSFGFRSRSSRETEEGKAAHYRRLLGWLLHRTHHPWVLLFAAPPVGVKVKERRC